MLERCPDSMPKFTTVLPNYKLIFTGWSRIWRGGVATIRRFSGGKVVGAVYEVSEQCLRRLDSYEKGYNRLNVIVFNEDSGPVEAVTYVRSGQVEETKPAKEYIALIQQGYRDWGIV